MLKYRWCSLVGQLITILVTQNYKVGPWIYNVGSRINKSGHHHHRRHRCHHHHHRRHRYHNHHHHPNHFARWRSPPRSQSQQTFSLLMFLCQVCCHAWWSHLDDDGDGMMVMAMVMKRRVWELKRITIDVQAEFSGSQEPPTCVLCSGWWPHIIFIIIIIASTKPIFSFSLTLATMLGLMAALHVYRSAFLRRLWFITSNI